MSVVARYSTKVKVSLAQCSAPMALLLALAAGAAIFDQQLDDEIAQCHMELEKGVDRITRLAAALDDTGAMSARVGGGEGDARSPLVIGSPLATVVSLSVSADVVDRLWALQETISGLQQQAFRIGRECRDNTELARHPEMLPYIQSLREAIPELGAVEKELKQEHQRILGKAFNVPPKQNKRIAARSLSKEDIMEQAHHDVSRDMRAYRAKAMDYQSTFRERQLQVQDKQHDLQRLMDGPDWPTEEWPLSTSDAQAVGRAEELMRLGLAELKHLLEGVGGLARVHESNDAALLVRIVALSKMMSKYCELIDSHVETVKRVHREKQRKMPLELGLQRLQSENATAAQTPKPHPFAERLAPPGVSLRNRLLSFGAQKSPRFAQLWSEGGTIHANTTTQPAAGRGGVPTKRIPSEIPLFTRCRGKPLRNKARWSSATPVYSSSHSHDSEL